MVLTVPTGAVVVEAGSAVCDDHEAEAGEAERRIGTQVGVSGAGGPGVEIEVGAGADIVWVGVGTELGAGVVVMFEVRGCIGVEGVVEGIVGAGSDIGVESGIEVEVGDSLDVGAGVGEVVWVRNRVWG
ncbi:hypothetical protein Pmani_004563 [Petrolisthes manimaculis]|uniref:Uncharacterized protein n=1 Tax=Petrolisthes manimaculis TaxID=1843537 RepID=A0AAE1QGL9_9EUCA|nr:hypothetical protein Pmani_004563 [Petrolisthes manimaculis]